jgi:phosphopantothenoylcysteine decarboxylase/phosphopantothenate--cysteine ligase
MVAAVRERAAAADVVVMAAAVADFRPRQAAAAKLKKEAGPPALDLVRNPDILAELPEWAPRALRVGFAAETSALEPEARRKLARKGAHLLVANDVSLAGVGFGSDDNEVVVYRREAPPIALGRKSKSELARELVDLIARELGELRREPVAGPR